MSRYLIKSMPNGCSPCNSNDYCKDTTRFFSNLADKLKNMAISINDRINRIKETSCQVVPGAVVFATVELPVMRLGVKYEYIEYIKRYGPPENGTFDPAKLELLRAELNIQESNYTI